MGEEVGGVMDAGHETCGDWVTEEASAEAFDRALESSGLFRIYREVYGELTQPRPGQVSKTVRIDRVLVPTANLLNRNWKHGAIGVEIKRSGEKIGPPLAQAIDYVRSVWRINGIWVHLGAVFLWPCEKHEGTVGSLMVHNRIGTVSPPTRWRNAYFQMGNETVLRIDSAGAEIGMTASGMKVGSR